MTRSASIKAPASRQNSSKAGELKTNTERAILPDDATERKQTPLFSGVLNYFPDAIIAVAQVSFKGNQQHNPGQPLHWAKEKSTDHLDCVIRHLFGVGTLDTDDGWHSAKLAWRALAICQLDIEASRDPNQVIYRDGIPVGRWVRGKWFALDPVKALLSE